LGIRRAYTTFKKKDIILDLLSQVGSVVKQLTSGGKGKEEEYKSTQAELLVGLKDTKKKKNPFNLIDLEAVKTKLLFGDADLIKKFKKDKVVDDKLQFDDKSSTSTTSTPTENSTPSSTHSLTSESKGKGKKGKEKKDKKIEKVLELNKEKEKFEVSNSLEIDALLDPAPNPKFVPSKDKKHKRTYSLQVPSSKK